MKKLDEVIFDKEINEITNEIKKDCKYYNEYAIEMDECCIVDCKNVASVRNFTSLKSNYEIKPIHKKLRKKMKICNMHYLQDLNNYKKVNESIYNKIIKGCILEVIAVSLESEFNRCINQ